MVKILIDGRLLSKKNTGISRYTEYVIKSYIKQYGVNEVFVLVNNMAWKADYNIIYTSYKPFNLIHFLLFPRYLKKYQFDIFHSTFYSGVFTKSKNFRYIITVHDLMYRIIPGFFSKIWMINTMALKYYNFIIKHSLRNADLVISVSETTKHDTKKFFNRESFVVPEGINLIESNQVDEFEVIKLNLEPQKYFLYVGNLRRQKNIDFLIDTFLHSNTCYPLVICGNYNTVPRKWQQFELIKFVGYIPDGVLCTLYKNCSAFIFPSLYEGFGLPILEALSNGALVISSNGGALKEFKCNRIHHFNPQNSNELRLLIENVDKLGTNNNVSEFLSSYSWEKSLLLMHQIIRAELKESIIN